VAEKRSKIKKKQCIHKLLR